MSKLSALPLDTNLVGTEEIYLNDAGADRKTTVEALRAPAATHAARLDNPHAVTKAQVGLSNVPNYPVATQEQAEAGTVQEALMTPLRTKQAITQQVEEVIPVATTEEAEAGTDNVKRMTPLRVAEAIASLTSGAALPLASQAEAEAGAVHDKVMTPLRVAQAIAELAGQAGGVTHLEIGDAGSPDTIWLRLREDGTALGFPRYRARGVTGDVEAEMKVVDIGGGDTQWQLMVGTTLWYVSEETEASATPDLVAGWDHLEDNFGKVMTLVAVHNGDYIQGRRPRVVWDTSQADLRQLLDTDGLVGLATSDDGTSQPGIFDATMVGGSVGEANKVGHQALIFVFGDFNNQLVRVRDQSGLTRDVFLPYTVPLRVTRGYSGFCYTEDIGMRPWRRTLKVNVVNNNGTANTLADLTQLGFAVKSGVTYRFRFVLPYQAAATTTGSRWTINGPAASVLAYRSVYGLTSTSETVNQLAAYNEPAAANASSPNTTGNIAIIEGVVTPSADGTLVPRFASEVSGSAITALARGFGELEAIEPGYQF